MCWFLGPRRYWCRWWRGLKYDDDDVDDEYDVAAAGDDMACILAEFLMVANE